MVTRDVLSLVQNQPWRYREDFPAWLEQNLPIWEGFKAEADALYAHGVRHWGARTIGEYLRRETRLRAVNDGEWKVNNNRWPDLARTYLMLYPEREGFFELREGEGRKVPRDLFGTEVRA